MKYKILLTGKNRSIIDDFFILMEDRFELMTTSYRFKDIQKHLELYEPDAFVYCMNDESPDTFPILYHVKNKLLLKKRIPFILIGTPEECSEFNQSNYDVTDLTLVRPINALNIQSSVSQYIDNHKRRISEEEAEAQAKKEAEEKAKKEAEDNAALNIAVKQAAYTAKEGKKHIMVIDDDTLMLKMIREHLRDKYEVVIVPSGSVALKFLETKTTDLILLDYEMPDESGPEVLEKLRQNPATADIPVLFLTGVTERSKIAKAISLKPQGYLLKPIDREKLFDAIEKTIGK